jgi:S1-C subfamily serine protease
MKFTINAIAATLYIVLASSPSSARGPHGSINIGNWQGGAYTDDKSGSFTHCAAGATYQSGIYFAVSVGENLSWRLGFAHENWQLTPGQAFALALTFDGQPAINVQGVPISSHLVNVEGQLFQFTLTQTAQLLPSLANCVVSVKKNGVANAGAFAVTPVAKPVVATAPAQSKPAKTVDKTGTGFVISNNGHIVTNQHVVEGCIGDIQGNLSGEAPIKLRLVSSDETNDLALLQAPSPLKEVATIRDKAIHPGDSVVAIGYPFHGLLTSDFTVTTGIVSSLSGILNDTRYLQISAAV